MDDWLICYNMQTWFFTNNGVQFASTFFATIEALKTTKHLATLTHNLRTNGHANWFNKTILKGVRYYVLGYQKGRYTSAQPSNYAYNIQPHRSLKKMPFTFVVASHRSELNLLKTDSVFTAGGYAGPSQQMLQSRLEARTLILRAKTISNLAYTQQHYK